ncbi:peptidase [Micromonospora sonneratiae]|uniref:Trypsin-like serine peptidase n=1 Tax=Micromonospora sonneratiae TaxID=1184706 RepID=A0ABW3YCH3_9ACTN
MHHNVWRGATLLLTTAATVVAVGGTATAAAAPTTVNISAVAQEEAAQFWTPERMRSAQPLDVRVNAMPKTVPAGDPVTIASFPNTGAAWTGGGTVVTTTGRVFFTMGDRTASCSGSAVVSTNKSTVITAGHCVKYQGAWHTNWTFVPAYNNGNAPYGTWTARSLQATPQWVASENISYDIGAAVVNTLNGQSLTDVVGGQSIAFNQARSQNMYAFGYPAAAPYDGTKLVYCSGKAFDEFLGTGDIGLNCNMTGGASGGPWFLSFSESAGTGALNSVNSFKYSFSTKYMFGPYFGTDALNLYNAAQSA